MCAAMSNMCRDEITGILKTKLDIVFGSSFNTNGLGGVLTCGVTGVKAGLSHSPISAVSSRSLSFGTASDLAASCSLYYAQHSRMHEVECVMKKSGLPFCAWVDFKALHELEMFFEVCQFMHGP